MKNMKRFVGCMLLGAALIMTGCAVYPVHHYDEGYGPPPHAPAHGYRYHYYDHDLVYDADLGVWLVIGFTNYYFLDGFYYRYSPDGWYYSRSFDRDWQHYREDKLPPGLYRKYHGHDEHGRDRGHERDNDKDRGRGRDDDRNNWRYRD